METSLLERTLQVNALMQADNRLTDRSDFPKVHRVGGISQRRSAWARTCNVLIFRMQFMSWDRRRGMMFGVRFDLFGPSIG